MKREDAVKHVSYVVDAVWGGCKLHAYPCAIVRQGGGSGMDESTGKVYEGFGQEFQYPSVLVGWQCGFEPLFVAVHSFLDIELSYEECEELAIDYLKEIGWFSAHTRQADYLI